MFEDESEEDDDWNAFYSSAPDEAPTYDLYQLLS